MSEDDRPGIPSGDILTARPSVQADHLKGHSNANLNGNAVQITSRHIPSDSKLLKGMHIFVRRQSNPDPDNFFYSKGPSKLRNMSTPDRPGGLVAEEI